MTIKIVHCTSAKTQVVPTRPHDFNLYKKVISGLLEENEEGRKPRNPRPPRISTVRSKTTRRRVDAAQLVLGGDVVDDELFIHHPGV